MDTPLKDTYTITFHRTRDHSLKLRGGAQTRTHHSLRPTAHLAASTTRRRPTKRENPQRQHVHRTATGYAHHAQRRQPSSNSNSQPTLSLEALCDSTDQRTAAVINGAAALLGHDNERRARESILYIAYDELNLVRGRILQTRGWDTAPTFLAAIIAAEDNGLITESQADNVLVADIIIEARRSSDRRPVHAVFEVSHTITLDDMQRAKERADTVAAATDTDAIAAVMGGIIQPPLLDTGGTNGSTRGHTRHVQAGDDGRKPA